MKYIHAILGAVGMAALLAAGGFAGPRGSCCRGIRRVGGEPPRVDARASIRLEVGRGTSWVGQAIPVVLKARFRDVEGVTLEGAPELTSDGVFTSDLAREPHQSTEIVDGEPVLVATWTGTITPSTAGPLALSVELPARIRFHESRGATGVSGCPRTPIRSPGWTSIRPTRRASSACSSPFSSPSRRRSGDRSIHRSAPRTTTP